MESDKLLEVEEVAEILGTSEDFLYHHWKKLPFAFKLSPKQLRFSQQGLQQWIEEKRTHAGHSVQTE